MKTITILSLLQTGILLILLGAVLLDEDRPPAPSRLEQGPLLEIPVANRSPDQRATAAYYPDEPLLRKIVREELAAQLNAIPPAGPDIDPVTAPEPVDAAHYEYQKERVAEQLNYHTSVGRISDADMQKLQREIAKLDPAGRREMLSRLVQAMNSGELQGRL